MQIELTKKLFTVDDYYQMAKAGILGPEERVELIDGEIIQAAKKVRAEDAHLVVEVSDTTLRYDRTIKLPRCAAAGIPEVWIENLVADELLVYRNPAGKGYSVSLTLHHGDSVSPVAFPDVVFNVSEILLYT